jgi:ABC-type amino acid transport substrate-binding protein
MFLKKRFEVLIGAEATIDFYLKQHHSTDKIRKATLKHATNMKSYFAISKKSPFNEHIPAISNALKQLNEQGEFQKLQQSALLKAKSSSPQ